MEMLTKILIGWAATIPLAMLASIVAYLILVPGYNYDGPNMYNMTNATKCE